MSNQLLFIESNTTGTGMTALQIAASMDLMPLFFTSNPKRYKGLAETGCQVIVCDTNDLAALQQTIEKHVIKENICGILTTSDYYLETVAELTIRYQLPGNPIEAIQKARNKGFMRQCLSEANIRQPLFSLIHSIKEVEAAVSEIGFPCVLKPADDSGSNNVMLVHTLEQARQHAATIFSNAYNMRGQKNSGVVLAEQYLDDPEFSVEMLTRNGQTTCIGITQKSLHGLPYFVESRHLFPAPIQADLAKEIESSVRQALKVIGIQQGATHTEVKVTSTGPQIIEINARLAGGMIPELIRLTSGVDMLKQQILCATGMPPQLNNENNGIAGIQFLMSKEAGTIMDIEGLEAARHLPGVKSAHITVKPGDQIQPPQNAFHRMGHVIVHSDSVEQTITLLQRAIDTIKIRVKVPDEGEGLS
ncbi:ATP-grasp domain-containing protein [Aneurinibacillus aneurinilyticus]|uniref:Phosphoribosylamine--glycine ligase n=1 Tax=Aneurinibacillus aneurinilyticus ATCC 12856 TaxID=649747 RepID=U1WAZ6_ANEAE|nr:ATP-grasp domain-containing protein [Aneurinibacillus aneurinilyticus]ERI05699.1 phosphoribosylamine--glycine ligase [Aneurinibacillus aneurinilyticus ATCC 12856]MED0708916.1 ATP-grasp domain-containing protein [Aneurinibacillus aneurinilyticus]MED0722911.1 ATP-grasp domain-containing protein [Aneurinibacillus aneurinilyticus]MED0732589.1 ATP-grasp domain-containing protein [Aneurinibacillus aneurinilyticus]MED0740685.1 ATP-grasp domain-containing protein [Aneurinibacillus aneurinilyticus]